jgi:RNA polymerase sigma-70 factor, ECF subfamily
MSMLLIDDNRRAATLPKRRLVAARLGRPTQGMPSSVPPSTGNRDRMGAILQFGVRKQLSGLHHKDFERLALPLLDPLYNFARWLSGDPDESRDLVQETMAKALKALSSFQEGTNFRAWMFRILRNTFLTSRSGLERRNTEQEDEDGFEELAVSHETPELELIRRADTELVRQGIARLPRNFQEVLLLADVEEMKYQEVAEALSIPVGTVMSRLARARKQLRGHILEMLNGRQSQGVKA